MKKKLYVAPEVELMECRVEKGFAGSDAYGENLTAHDNGEGNDVNENGEKMFT